MEILNCTTCTRDRPTACGVCPLYLGQQPEITPAHRFWVVLYNRCQRYKTLPYPGGLLDQPDRVMAMLDVVGECRQQHEARQQKK